MREGVVQRYVTQLQDREAYFRFVLRNHQANQLILMDLLWRQFDRVQPFVLRQGCLH